MNSTKPFASRTTCAGPSSFPALACGLRSLHTRRYVSTVIAWIHFPDAHGMQRLRNRATLASRRRCLGWTDAARACNV